MIKDPNATLDYRVDWSQWLSDGETITSSTWLITPDGLTEVTTDHDATSATVWLSGGTAHERYWVTNRITTSAGRTDQRTLPMNLQNR